MKIKKLISFGLPGLAILLISTYLNADTLEFSSGKNRVNLIELYTSEGCSSCPPADRWLNEIKGQQGLWGEMVPVAFHVDYWDYLGWKDAYADPIFAVRQDKYAQHGFVSSVYTPAILVNGRGSRFWRFKSGFSPDKNDKPGILDTLIDNNQLTARFFPESIFDQNLILNIALLGTNLVTKVKAGENSGDNLAHDFVVLSFKRVISDTSYPYEWQVDDLISDVGEKITAIAVWVNRRGDPTPIQASGSWIGRNHP